MLQVLHIGFMTQCFQIQTLNLVKVHYWKFFFEKHDAGSRCFVDVDLKRSDNEKQKKVLLIVTKLQKKLIPHLSQNIWKILAT